MEMPQNATWQVSFDANPFLVDALNLSITDPVTFEQSGVSMPTGTGPLVFGDYVQGDHLRLNENPDYWDNGKPYLDQLQFRIFTDPKAMMVESESGTLDVALRPLLVDWVRMRITAIRTAGTTLRN